LQWRNTDLVYSTEAGSTCATDTDAEAFQAAIKTDFSFQHDTLWAYIIVPDNNLRLTMLANAHTYNHAGQQMSSEANVVLYGSTTSLPKSSVMIWINSLFPE